MRIIWLVGPQALLLATQLAVANEQPSPEPQAAAATGGSSLSLVIAVVLLVAACAGAWGVWRFFIRRKQGPVNNPRKLLHELCRAHGLSRRAERLLRKAAAALETPHAGRFFLEPQLMQQALKCEQLRGSRRALSLLHDRLFGEDTA